MSLLHKQLPRLKFSHVITGFADDLEKMYYDDFFRISLPVVRVALLLGIALYALFGILDIWIVPIHKQAVWIIRYGAVCPALTAALIMSYFRVFHRYMQPVIATVGFMAGAGIVLMIAISVESEPGFKFYYAGLMLVIMWVYALVRLRFTYATIVSWMITALYEATAISVNRLLDTTTNTLLFVNNNYFFIGSNIIGMFACFTIEWYMRKNFLLRGEIAKSYNLNRKYLDNIKEGLLLIDENFQIMNQYSSYLLSMFGRNDFSNTNFVELIYPDIEGNTVESDELKKFLLFLFHNKTADLEMIMELNPFRNKKITIRSDSNETREITVNADFTRIQHGGIVEFVMIIFEDITEILNYEKQISEQKSRHLKEIESVAVILRNGPSLFTDFLRESEQTLKDISSKKDNLEDQQTLNTLFREVHSLKGAAKHLELNIISALCHRIEDILSGLRNDPEQKTPDAMKQLDELTINLSDEFKNLGIIIERIREFSSGQSIPEGYVKSDELRRFLDSLIPMTGTIAKELNKEINLVIENNLTDLQFLPKIKNPIIHLIRNSIDHGIEDEFERLSKRKERTGLIHLRLYSSDTAYIIEVEDDGAGIDFEKIRSRGLEKNLIHDDSKTFKKSDLIQLIFTPGFSSKKSATEISGRGYGLDIVKEAAVDLQGKVIVSTKTDIGTTIKLSIPH